MSEDLRLFKTGRLAMRREGDRVALYFALPNSMEGAIELARFHIAVANILGQDLILEIGKNVVEVLIRDAGQAIEWPEPPVDAPEHERSGRS